MVGEEGHGNLAMIQLTASNIYKYQHQSQPVSASTLIAGNYGRGGGGCNECECVWVGYWVTSRINFIEI